MSLFAWCAADVRGWLYGYDTCVSVDHKCCGVASASLRQSAWMSTLVSHVAVVRHWFRSLSLFVLFYEGICNICLDCCKNPVWLTPEGENCLVD